MYRLKKKIKKNKQTPRSTMDVNMIKNTVIRKPA